MVIDDYKRLSIGDELFKLRSRRNAFVPSPSVIGDLITEPHMGARLTGNLFYFVEYQQGAIQYTELPAGAWNGISDMFSGCAMAYFVFNGFKYLAHISLNNTPDYDKRTVWNDFVRRNQQHITQYAIFRPFDSRSGVADFMYCSYGMIDKNFNAVGIITPNLECYSAVNDLAHNLVYCHHETARRHFSNNLSREARIEQFLIPDVTSGW